MCLSILLAMLLLPMKYRARSLLCAVLWIVLQKKNLRLAVPIQEANRVGSLREDGTWVSILFLEIAHMMLVEQRIAGKGIFKFKNKETGAGLLNATHISGFERSHVRVCFILSCTVISFELTLVFECRNNIE